MLREFGNLEHPIQRGKILAVKFVELSYPVIAKSECTDEVYALKGQHLHFPGHRPGK